MSPVLLQSGVLKLRGLQTIDAGCFHLAEMRAPGADGGIGDLLDLCGLEFKGISAY